MELKPLSTPYGEELRELLESRTGLLVPEFHSRWFFSQLVDVCRVHGFTGFEELIRALAHKDLSDGLWIDAIHAVTVHETYWLRNSAPLKQAISALGSTRERVRILSLGCAFGQEAFTAYFFARELHPGVEVMVKGIDISPVCVGMARTGRFLMKEDFSGIEPYLQEGDGFRRGEVFQFSDSVMARLDFQIGNALDPYVAGFQEYDLIVCQNCLTYYEEETRAKVSNNLTRCLTPGGMMIFASAELLGCRPDRTYPLSDEWSQILVKEL